MIQQLTTRMIALALLALTLGGCASDQPKTVKHVILISLDGSRPEFYLDPSWHTPNLRKFMEKGVYSKEGVKSVFPSFTYPSHTAMVTGALPIHHGIYNNTPYDGVRGQWLSDAKDIQSPTLWDAVQAAGMTSGAVMWPVTVGAPIDYNFPERFPMEGEEDKDVLTIKYPYVQPKSLLTDIEQATGTPFTADDLSTKKNFNEAKTITLIANYIIKKYKPNLMGIHMIAMDHQEHAHGTDAPEVRAAVQITDSLIGTIIQTVKAAGIWENTAVIFIGDHGHANTMASFAPNVYLAQHGLIKGKEWKAKFYAAGGSSFLYLKDKNDQALVDSVAGILKQSPEFKAGAFRILDREALDTMGAATNTQLGIAMKEGFTVRNGATGKTFTEKDGSTSTHGYDPNYKSMYTAFIAAGPGIARHKEIEGMCVTDIAPLVARLLNLDFDAPDGHLPAGLFADE